MISKGYAAEAQALKLAQRMRQAGFSVELDLSGSGFKTIYTGRP
jgi:histidyl-tRNA synthetase